MLTDIIISKNGCRRVDIPGHGDYGKHGWMKFMEQNKEKAKAMAERARGMPMAAGR